MKHNRTRLMKILIFYSLIMSFSCATCMSTLGFCIIIFLFSGSLRQIVRQFHKSGFPIDRPCFVPLAPGFLGFQDPRLDHVALHQMRKDALPRSSFRKKLATSSRWSGRLGPQWATMNSMQSSVDSRSNSFFGSVGGA